MLSPTKQTRSPATNGAGAAAARPGSSPSKTIQASRPRPARSISRPSSRSRRGDRVLATTAVRATAVQSCATPGGSPCLIHGVARRGGREGRAVSAAPPPIRIVDLARERLGLSAEALDPYGHYKAKLSLEALAEIGQRPPGKLILVTAVNPTPAGEGKTTTTIGLGDALSRVGQRAMICLREPALGPCFGMKGGGAGGGRAQVVPMEDINLHFTGDMHAVASAHNLLAALIDNHIHFDNPFRLDLRRLVWNRVLDCNDRILRQVVVGLGGTGNGFPREESFGIVVASEVMAVLCLAMSHAELRDRLGNMLVGYTRLEGQPVLVQDLQAQGAMAVLLREALRPNLVQTLEGTPAFVHGGPFANIAHGCNSALATHTALRLADYVVTEAGFGADLGAEKFIDIKCRKTGLRPSLAVVVATVRALKYHGGVDTAYLGLENLQALRRGMSNLKRHLHNLRTHFGLPVVVAINPFETDTPAELDLLAELVTAQGVAVAVSRAWADGSAGAEELARTVLRELEQEPGELRFLYHDETSLWDKLTTVATKLYGCSEVIADTRVRRQIAEYSGDYGHFPVCLAKTQYSFSSDPDLRGAPTGHVLPIREVRLARGAEFLVAYCGHLLTMPGLPRRPAAERIDLDAAGNIIGLV
ncbi:MAG: formate--tetrahydrofolate ligase [Fimbriimonadaceae bacterium]|nr:formate--tetrahydrofolate ligase [Fimbriimonadaceae bacterium]